MGKIDINPIPKPRSKPPTINQGTVSKYISNFFPIQTPTNVLTAKFTPIILTSERAFHGDSEPFTINPPWDRFPTLPILSISIHKASYTVTYKYSAYL